MKTKKTTNVVFLLVAVVALTLVGYKAHSMVNFQQNLLGNDKESSNVSSVDNEAKRQSSNRIIKLSGSALPLDDAELSREADVIVIGEVKEIKQSHRGIEYNDKIREELARSNMTPEAIKIQEERDKNYVFTNVALKVEQYLKTDLGTESKPNEIVVKTTGGTAGGITLVTDKEMPRFEDRDKGKKVLLFLERSYDDSLRPFVQGSFKIEGEQAINEYFPENNMAMSNMQETVNVNKMLSKEPRSVSDIMKKAEQRSTVNAGDR
jgi:hypothetical protein